MDEPTIIEHESFGSIEISRVQGRVDNLYGYSFPVNSFISIKFGGSKFQRSLSHDRFYTDKFFHEVWMSETQFAQLITSLNAGSTPCTIRYMLDGNLKKVEDPPQHMIDVEGLKSEVSAQADEARKELDAAISELTALAGNATVSKVALRAATERLVAARQHIETNLAWREQCAHKTINNAAVKAKTDIKAFADVLLRNSGLMQLAADNGALKLEDLS